MTRFDEESTIRHLRPDGREEPPAGLLDDLKQDLRDRFDSGELSAAPTSRPWYRRSTWLLAASVGFALLFSGLIVRRMGIGEVEQAAQRQVATEMSAPPSETYRGGSPRVESEPQSDAAATAAQDLGGRVVDPRASEATAADSVVSGSPRQVDDDLAQKSAGERLRSLGYLGSETVSEARAAQPELPSADAIFELPKPESRDAEPEPTVEEGGAFANSITVTGEMERVPRQYARSTTVAEGQAVSSHGAAPIEPKPMPPPPRTRRAAVADAAPAAEDAERDGELRTRKSALDVERLQKATGDSQRAEKEQIEQQNRESDALERQKRELEEQMKALQDESSPDAFEVAEADLADVEPARAIGADRGDSAGRDAMASWRRTATDPRRDPLSTFGVDVDTGSYTRIRSHLDAGRLPPPSEVRTEEVVNYFDYELAPPRRGDFALAADGVLAWDPRRPGVALARFSIKARELRPGRRAPAALTFVVDVSGSMERDGRLEMVKEGLALLLDQLAAGDTVSLVTYNDVATLMLQPTDDLELVRRRLRNLRPGGSTNLADGLTLGYEMAARAFRSGNTNRVILCSDGIANVGSVDPEHILRRVGDEASRGIELTTVGVGLTTYNDVMMERLADRGDGRYAYIDSSAEAYRIFARDIDGTLETVARDARVQVEFDPALIARYRLVGYANRDLPDEVFRRRDVDGGEIGVGHAVTALYEIELRHTPRAGSELATLTLLYEDPLEHGLREQTATLRGGALARAPVSAGRDLRLAMVAATFAESLLQPGATGAARLDRAFRQAQTLSPEFPGRSDVAELAALVGKARDLMLRGR